MPSRSFLSANKLATAALTTTPVVSEHRRSPRLAQKNNDNDLVRCVLNIPLYVPKLGSADCPADSVDFKKNEDVSTIKTYLERAEKLLELKPAGRDVILARIVNAACVFIHLCENPFLLAHHPRFRRAVRNKRLELLGSVKYYRAATYTSDTEFLRVCTLYENICTVIKPILLYDAPIL
jgi:hypothetical protein